MPLLRLTSQGLGTLSLHILHSYFQLRGRKTPKTVWSMLPEKRLLVLAPHPDDETIGAGGTLAAARDVGAEIHVAVITDGCRAEHPHLTAEEIAQRRREEVKRATGLLGAELSLWEITDGELEVELPVEPMSQLLLDWQPDAVLLPCFLDYHPDHAAVTRLLEAGIAALPEKLRPQTLYLYQVQTPLSVSNIDLLVDTTPYAPVKDSLLECYQQPVNFSLLQKMETLYPGLGRFRGTAECFARLEPALYFQAHHRWQQERSTRKRKLPGCLPLFSPVNKEYRLLWDYFKGYKEKQRLARIRQELIQE